MSLYLSVRFLLVIVMVVSVLFMFFACIFLGISVISMSLFVSCSCG